AKRNAKQKIRHEQLENKVTAELEDTSILEARIVASTVQIHSY
ncbi:hypothetical protein DBR06_SOUSAS19810008, partial [Sousa chinensis]